jgi:hypothetical protein
MTSNKLKWLLVPWIYILIKAHKKISTNHKFDSFKHSYKNPDIEISSLIER